MVYRIQSP